MKSYVDVVARLRKVLDLEKASRKRGLGIEEREVLEKEITLLRKQIPDDVVQRHDRLMERGRKPIVAVRNFICTACHLQLPPGWNQFQDEKLPVCPHCGTLVYFEAPAPVIEAAVPVPVLKLKKRSVAPRAIRKTSRVRQ